MVRYSRAYSISIRVSMEAPQRPAGQNAQICLQGVIEQLESLQDSHERTDEKQEVRYHHFDQVRESTSSAPKQQDATPTQAGSRRRPSARHQARLPHP